MVGDGPTVPLLHGQQLAQHSSPVAGTLPNRMEQAPLAWMIQVNGPIADARHVPRAIHQEAYRKGLIPYIPDDRAGDPTKE